MITTIYDGRMQPEIKKHDRREDGGYAEISVGWATGQEMCFPRERREDIYEKLNASSLGEASYFLGSRMLRITEAVWTDANGRRVDIGKAPRVQH